MLGAASPAAPFLFALVVKDIYSFSLNKVKIRLKEELP